MPRLERWLAHPDPDVRWVMKENLRKQRLSRMDAAWVGRWQPPNPFPHTNEGKGNKLPRFFSHLGGASAAMSPAALREQSA